MMASARAHAVSKVLHGLHACRGKYIQRRECWLPQALKAPVPKDSSHCKMILPCNMVLGGLGSTAGWTSSNNRKAKRIIERLLSTAADGGRSGVRGSDWHREAYTS